MRSGIVNPEVFVGTRDEAGRGGRGGEAARRRIRRRFALRHNDHRAPAAKRVTARRAATTGRSCNCIAASPTAKLQVETARGIPTRASRTRARARRCPLARPSRIGSGLYPGCTGPGGPRRRNARNYVRGETTEAGGRRPRIRKRLKFPRFYAEGGGREGRRGQSARNPPWTPHSEDSR